MSAVKGQTGTSDPDRALRREQLLDAADAVVRRLGPAASMQALAAEAGVTKPILYRFFGDKGGLYRALAERHTEALLAVLRGALAAPGDLRARSHRTVSAYLAAVAEEPEVYRFLVHGEAAAEPAVGALVAGFVRRVADALIAGLARELALPADDPRLAVWAHGVVGATRSAGDWWLDHRGEPGAPDLATVADGVVDLLAGEVLARAVPPRAAAAPHRW